MKFSHFVIAAGILVLSACNFPEKRLTPTPDILGTVVAQTVTALPTSTSTPEVRATETPAPSPTEIATSTQLPVSTATLASDDFAASLGTPNGKDTLDSGQGFGIGPEGYEDEGVSIKLDNGMLSLKSFSRNGWRSWRVRPPELSGAYIEAKIIADACAESDQFGLAVRTQSYESGQGYYLGISCDGKYRFSRWDDSGITALIPPTTAQELLANTSQVHRIGVLSRGSTFTIYLNGKQVNQVTDAAFQKGFYGVFVSGYSGGLSVRLDEISYWVTP